jgi:hypothetical protein
MTVWRVSHVEAFRRYEQDEEVETERLLAVLRGAGEESERMRVGTAFHKALEVAVDGVAPELSANGYTFRFVPDADMAIELPVLREIRAARTYEVDGGPITISGCADGVTGRRVGDYKSTERFDAERYMAGYQWRLYLDIFALDVFRWDIFELAETDDPKVWLVKSLHRLEQYRYPRLHDDCRALVTRFAAFVRGAGLA